MSKENGDDQSGKAAAEPEAKKQKPEARSRSPKPRNQKPDSTATQGDTSTADVDMPDVPADPSNVGEESTESINAKLVKEAAAMGHKVAAAHARAKPPPKPLPAQTIGKQRTKQKGKNK